jgi:site-specific recombinase XerD
MPATGDGGITRVSAASRALVPRSFEPIDRRRPAADPEDVAGSFAANTRAAYAADWRAWETWARIHNVPTLPADPHELVGYLKEMARSGFKVATVKRRLSGIAQIHKLAGEPLDLRAASLEYALKRIAREHGAPRVGRAEVMTADLEAMLKHLDRSSARGMRDAAILLVGFAAGLRSSEIVGLNFGDVEFGRDGAIILLRRSKTDQGGQGQQVGILYGRREAMCPVRALKGWMKLAQAPLIDAKGPIFGHIREGIPTAQRLRRDAVWSLVKRLGTAAGLDAARLGAHSLRVGHVTQALANGADVVKAKDQLRHKRLDTTLGYNRRRSLLADNTSGKLGL